VAAGRADLVERTRGQIGTVADECRIASRGEGSLATIGDIIEAVNGKPVASFAALINVLDTHEFGDRIALTVRRGNARIEVPIVLPGSR